MGLLICGERLGLAERSYRRWQVEISPIVQSSAFWEIRLLHKRPVDYMLGPAGRHSYIYFFPTHSVGIARFY